MSTNREKYIDNASDEELAGTLTTGFYRIRTMINISDEYLDVKKWILKWLSQEAEEERTCGSCKFHKKVEPCKNAHKLNKKCVNSESPACGAYTIDDCSCDNWEAKEPWGIDENHTQVVNLPVETKKVELTERVYKDILARLDELEESEYHNAMAIERLEEINEYESNIDDVETKTADEMFEELGYERHEHNGYDEYDTSELYYTKKINDKVEKKIVILKEMWRYRVETKNDEYKNWMYITEAEDKAIHKKIEELKQNEN